MPKSRRNTGRKLADKDVFDVIGGRPDPNYAMFVAELQKIRAIKRADRPE